MSAAFTLDFDQAARFLTLLDESVERFTFLTFDDLKARKDPALTRILHGTLKECWPELCRLSAAGAGVFVTVNETNGKGRKAPDIIRVRAVFQECDRPGTPEPPLQPHIVVESSPGKFHRYFLVDGGTRFDLFDGVMRRLVADYGSDPNAKDLARVLRLPGFPHQKDPTRPWLVRVIQDSGERPYPWQEITAKIPPLVATKTPPPMPAGQGIDNPAKVDSALAVLDPDREYGAWLQIGMALHHATGGGATGFRLWDNFSARGELYRPGETAQKWQSFGNHNGTPVTLASLFKLAAATGWRWQDTPKTPDSGPPQPPPYGEPAKGKKPCKLLTVDEVLARQMAHDWLVKGYIECKQTCVLYGESQSYKSLLAIEITCAVALAMPWRGHDTKSGAVLYIVGEGGGGGLTRRLRAWEMANHTSLKGAPLIFREAQTLLPIDTHDIIEEARDFLKDRGCIFRFVILDTGCFCPTSRKGKNRQSATHLLSVTPHALAK